MTGEIEGELSGTISKLSVHVQPGCFGVVTLDEAFDGFTLAVINHQTQGRQLLSPDGVLGEGMRVVIDKFARALMRS